MFSALPYRCQPRSSREAQKVQGLGFGVWGLGFGGVCHCRQRASGEAAESVASRALGVHAFQGLGFTVVSKGPLGRPQMVEDVCRPRPRPTACTVLSLADIPTCRPKKQIILFNKGHCILPKVCMVVGFCHSVLYHLEQEGTGLMRGRDGPR